MSKMSVYFAAEISTLSQHANQLAVSHNTIHGTQVIFSWLSQVGSLLKESQESNQVLLL